LTWITSGGTGSRTLQANGDLVLKKLTATQWEVFGLGVSWNMLAAPDWMAKARPANDNDQLRAAA
jgi:hypothetical protein